MATFHSLISRLAAPFSGRSWSGDLNAEFETHLQLQIDANLRAGMSEREARRAALDKLGAPAVGVEAYRERMVFGWLDTLLRDVRYGLRSMRRSPGFVTVAILTLALGIGANTAMFSVIYATLVHPLPFPDLDRLYVLREQGLMGNDSNVGNPVSPRNYLDWQAANKSFSSMAALRGSEYNLGSNDGHSRPERVYGAVCSYTLFGTLGVKPVIGRTFTADEDKKGAPHVALISYGLWQSHFGGAAGITHRTIRLDGEEYSIVGVMPPGFSYPARDTVIWSPLLPVSSTEGRGNHQLLAVARLRPGVTLAHAQAEMNLIAKNILASEPDALTARTVGVIPMAEYVGKRSSTILLTLLAAVACLLLIACVNVANLLLARGSRRAREFGVRVALGAGRGRLLRQLLTEGLLLFACGALAGLAFACGLNVLLAHYLPRLLNSADIDLFIPSVLDWHALLFMLLCAAVVGAATSLLPAWRAARLGAVSNADASGRTATGGRKSHRTQNTLVAGEVALCTLLLVAAGLLARSLYNLQRVDPGVRTGNVLTATVALPGKQYATQRAVSGFTQQLIDRLAATPGVVSAATIDVLPLDGWQNDTTIEIDGRPMPRGQWIDPMHREASPTYFATMGIPILQGRAFTVQDSEPILSSEPHGMGAVIINKALAQRFWPRGDAVGCLIHYGDAPGARRYQIVGVVGDVTYQLGNAPDFVVYTAALDGESQAFHIVVRTTLDPLALAPALRAAVKDLDSGLPVFAIRTMDEVASQNAAPTRCTSFLLGSLALLALLLASIGLYGVLSYGVEQQRNEIGLRIALGSSRAQVLRRVVAQGLRPALAGLAAGLLAAFALAKLGEPALRRCPRDLSTCTAVVP